MSLGKPAMVWCVPAFRKAPTVARAHRWPSVPRREIVKLKLPVENAYVIELLKLPVENAYVIELLFTVKEN